MLLSVLGPVNARKVKMPEILKRVGFFFSLLIFGIIPGLLGATPVAQKRPPNILLLTVDALRPDHLSCYGYGRKTSPRIDALAEQGTLFDQTISQASVTIVSLASLMTSVYPPRHGIITQHLDMGGDFTCPTLPEILRNRNYRTAVCLPDGAAITGARWPRKKADYRLVYPSGKESPDYAFLNRKIMDWIKEDPQQSFFVWIHYRGAHTPYMPPAPYNKIFVNDKFYDLKKKIPLVENLYGWGGISKKANLHDVQEVDYYVAQYDGAIRYVDSSIGALLDSLKKEGMYENTLVVLSADHGEALGEHNLYFEHANTVYDELLKVPLIMKFPEGAFTAGRFGGQVRLVDIMPTVLEYLKIKSPDNLDGISLLPVIKKKSVYAEVPSFSKTYSMNAIRSQGWKLITWDSRSRHDELYDLKKDPGELNDLSFKEPEIVQDLRGKMALFSGGLSCQCGVERVEDDYNPEKAAEILRSLGYVQ